MSDTLRALREIEARDPDGGTREPTEADYLAHEAWAVAAYGQQAWAAYSQGGWEPGPQW